MISILLVGFRASPWQLRQVWRFGAEIQPPMILSESEKYGFVGVFWWFCCCCGCCSFLPPHPQLCTVCSSLAATVPLYPYHYIYFPSYFLLYFHFSSFLGLTFLYFTRLTSPFCVVWVASPLTCLHHCSRSIENRITQFLSEEYLSVPCQWEESKGTHHQVVQPRVGNAQCISPSSRCLGCQALRGYCLQTHCSWLCGFGVWCWVFWGGRGCDVGLFRGFCTAPH